MTIAAICKTFLTERRQGLSSRYICLGTVVLWLKKIKICRIVDLNSLSSNAAPQVERDGVAVCRALKLENLH